MLTFGNFEIDIAQGERPLDFFVHSRNLGYSINRRLLIAVLLSLRIFEGKVPSHVDRHLLSLVDVNLLSELIGLSFMSGSSFSLIKNPLNVPSTSPPFGLERTSVSAIAALRIRFALTHGS